MKYNFDIRGYLKPYEKIECSLDEFNEVFVSRLDIDSKRTEIYASYLNYLSEFKNQMKSDFVHWINGSFVTKTKNPKDIDFVIILDYRILEDKRKSEDLKNHFFNKYVMKDCGLDPYLLLNYPKDHKLYIRTKSDLLYWNDWFTKSKMDHRKKRYPKGYISIKFQ